jgi:hypothetical protein
MSDSSVGVGVGVTVGVAVAVGVGVCGLIVNDFSAETNVLPL